MANVKEVMKMVAQSHKSKQQEVAKMEKKPRVKMMTKKPYDGLKSGTTEWKECWKKHPELQEEMLRYAKNNTSKTKEVPEVKQSTRKRIKVETEFEKHKREEAERQRKIDEYIAKNGVETKRKRVGHGEAAEDWEAEQMVTETMKSEATYEEIQAMSRKKLIDFLGDIGYDNDVGDTKTDTLKNAICDELDLYPEEEDEPVVRKKIQPKEVVMKKPIKKEIKSKQREVIPVKTQAFGAEGQTFDKFAVSIPKNVQTIKQLKAWLIEEGRHVLEFKRGEIRAYDNERVTESGRVAKVTVKKQGERMIPTYRSNKNSRTVK